MNEETNIPSPKRAWWRSFSFALPTVVLLTSILILVFHSKEMTGSTTVTGEFPIMVLLMNLYGQLSFPLIAKLFTGSAPVQFSLETWIPVLILNWILLFLFFSGVEWIFLHPKSKVSKVCYLLFVVYAISMAIYAEDQTYHLIEKQKAWWH